MSVHGDYSWKAPRCLLENTSGKEMKVNESTIELLRNIHDPMVVVAIVGLYRTGKSYLMNKLAGKQSGFDLGNTVQAQTKGIWIWCIRHPSQADTCLVLLDTEGLGDVEKGDTQNDVLLFTLAALLSSTLVYNSKGTIDQSAMDNIYFVTEIAEKLKITEKSESSEENDVELAEHFPRFVWAVRDFSLELMHDGNPITADQYLEHALTLKKGAGKKVTDFNLPRKCIRRYFPHRRCFVFPPPVGTPEAMSRLEKLSESQLLPMFNERTKEFCAHILQNSNAKAIGGHVLNGPKFAGVTVQYADQISKGKIPSIESAVVSMARRVNEDALSECTKQYRKAMETFQLPSEDDKTLDLHHQQCEKTVRTLFFKLAMIVEDENQATTQFTDMINKEYKEVCARNDECSRLKSEQLLEDLQQPLQTKFNSGYYFKVGGYTEYQQDIADMVKKYLMTPGKGVQGTKVLDALLKKQFATAKSIMAVDRNMTEAQQKTEADRLQQEQMKKEMEEMKKANERSEHRHQEQMRLQKEFMNSMQIKFNQELDTYKKQLNQLKAQLETEHRKLQKEGADEDAEELENYFKILRARGQTRQPTFQGIRYLFR